MTRPTGLERVWLDVLRPLASANVIVMTPLVWSADMRTLAQFIKRNGGRNAAVVAYSWGAGVGAINFARACYDLGICIRVMVLCDPVFRSGFLPTWLPVNPLSLTRLPKIGIPPSVCRVTWVRQNLDYPRGHDLVAIDSRATRIDPAGVLNHGHRVIDDSPEFAAIVKREMEAFATEP